MKKEKSTFQKVLTTGKRTLTIVVGSALGFATPHIIAAKAPSNVDIFHRIAQERIERNAEPTAKNLDVQIEELAKGLDEAYQLAKSEAVRQSPFVGYVNDQISLELLGAPKGTKALYILSKDATLDKGDIVLPIDKNGKFIPQSYVLSATLPENIKNLDYLLVRNATTEGIFSYAVDNKGNFLSNFTPKDEFSTEKKTLEEKVTKSPTPCANVTGSYYNREYVANAITIVNMTGEDQTRTAPIGGSVDCNTTPTSTLKKIDDTTVAWSCDTPFQDLYGVSMSTPSPIYTSPSQGGVNYNIKQ